MWFQDFLEWRLCPGLAIVQTLLTSMAGLTFENLSSRHAIKLEHPPKTQQRRSGSPASQLAADFNPVFHFGPLQSNVYHGWRGVRNIWKEDKIFLSNLAKNNKLASPQGVSCQRLAGVAVLSVQDIRGQWLYMEHWSHVQIHQEKKEHVGRAQLSVVLSLSAQFAVCLDLICQIISTSHHMLSYCWNLLETVLSKAVDPCRWRKKRQGKSLNLLCWLFKVKRSRTSSVRAFRTEKTHIWLQVCQWCMAGFGCFFVDTIYACSSCHSQARLSQKCRS